MEDFTKLPSDSRIWVYAANRDLKAHEAEAIVAEINRFTQNWTSHDMPLKGAAALLYNRLVLIAVDEQTQGVSGCGIDKSVKLMKDLGAAYGIDFFNRLQILELKPEQSLQSYTKQELQEAINRGLVHEDTLVFNPMVQNLAQFQESGFVRLASFWMAKQLTFPAQVNG